MQVERLVNEIEGVEQLENELELPGNEIGNRQVAQGFSIICGYCSTTERSRRQLYNLCITSCLLLIFLRLQLLINKPD